MNKPIEKFAIEIAISKVKLMTDKEKRFLSTNMKQVFSSVFNLNMIKYLKSRSPYYRSQYTQLTTFYLDEAYRNIEKESMEEVLVKAKQIVNFLQEHEGKMITRSEMNQRVGFYGKIDLSKLTPT